MSVLKYVTTHWKTSLGGVLAAAPQIYAATTGHNSQLLLTAIGTLILGLAAPDADKVTMK
jgi:hypothetical protein